MQPLIRVNERNYFHCPTCFAICMHPKDFPNWEEEKTRYKTHNNDVFDPNYQNFVGPIVNSILSGYSRSHKGLDFGSGTGPVITKLLRDKKYAISTYDPFFDPSMEKLNQVFDYIACCEVIEHFHHPQREFQLLSSLLKRGGHLYCMTEIYDDSIDFENWYYKNDFTHVIFYHAKTLEWIKAHFNFSKVVVRGRLIIFEKDSSK
jgi:SAM-dependent methyltransferase